MNIDYTTPTFNLYGPEERGWSYTDPFDYSTLSWDETLGPKPNQLDLALASVEHYYNQEVSQYKEQRGAKYPPIEEQLDQIYHGSVTAWKKTIKAIKDAHPKTAADSEELERRKQEVRDFLSS